MVHSNTVSVIKRLRRLTCFSWWARSCPHTLDTSPAVRRVHIRKRRVVVHGWTGLGGRQWALVKPHCADCAGFGEPGASSTGLTQRRAQPGSQSVVQTKPALFKNAAAWDLEQLRTNPQGTTWVSEDKHTAFQSPSRSKLLREVRISTNYTKHVDR